LRRDGSNLSKVIGWTPFDEGVYQHLANKKAAEVQIVGLAHAYTQASNVLASQM
jgi:hypothetical protein